MHQYFVPMYTNWCVFWITIKWLLYSILVYFHSSTFYQAFFSQKVWPYIKWNIIIVIIMLQTAVNTVTPDFRYLSPPQWVVSGSGFTITMGLLLLMHANKDRVIWNGEWDSALWTQSDTENISTTKLLFYGFNLRYFLLERAEVQLQPFFMNKNWTRQCLQIQKEWKTTAYVSNSCITCQIFK